MTEYSWAEETNARINRYKFREDNKKQRKSKTDLL